MKRCYVCGEPRVSSARCSICRPCQCAISRLRAKQRNRPSALEEIRDELQIELARVTYLLNPPPKPTVA